MTPNGSRPRTGVRNEISTPRSPLVANVRPRSVIARRAGPAVFQIAYGPVTATSAMFVSGVDTRHGPNRASSAPDPTSTQALSGVMPNARANTRYAGGNAKPKCSGWFTSRGCTPADRGSRDLANQSEVVEQAPNARESLTHALTRALSDLLRP